MRILILGYGDVAQRLVRALPARAQWRALVRSPRALPPSVTPFVGDLDDLRSLARLRGAAEHVIYLAPPPPQGDGDARLAHALAALGPRMRTLVYVSTTGVYGDCNGEFVDETRAVNPQSARAKRRVAAEQMLRDKFALRVVRLRAPGIYADDRVPTDRIVRGTPALAPQDDSFSNHIHADDLARACWFALFRGKAHRAYNVTDGEHIKMGDWFDRVADVHALPRVPRLPSSEIRARVSPELWSFMRESRRIGNARLVNELRLIPRPLSVQKT